MKITMNKLFDLPSKERDKIINPVFTGLLKAAYSNETIEAALRDSPLINTSVNGAKKLNRIAPSSMAKVTSFGAKASVILAPDRMAVINTVVQSFATADHCDASWPCFLGELTGARYNCEDVTIEIEDDKFKIEDPDGTTGWIEMSKSPIGNNESRNTATQENPDMNNAFALSPEQSDVINTIFDKYTNGAIKDVTPVLQSHFKHVPELQVEVDTLREQLANIPKIQVPLSRPSSGDIPKGKVAMRNAQDVFGVQSNLLDFEITTWEWGAPHPHVPERFDNYRFDVEKLAQYLYGLEHNLNQWLVGHTGTGKSTWVEQVCAHTGYPLQRMNFDADITRMEFVGSTQVVIDESGKQVTKFVEGFLPRAMQAPCVMLLDEADAIQGDVAYVLQAVLEHKPFRLLEDSGRLVDPDPHFRIVATANTVGQGDPTGLYSTAVKSQSTAQRNRYNVFLEIDYMQVDDEIALCKELNPMMSNECESFMTQFLRLYREGFANGDVMEPISPRNTQTIAQAITFFEPKIGLRDAVAMSVKMNLTSRANESDAAVINGLLDRLTA